MFFSFTVTNGWSKIGGTVELDRQSSWTDSVGG